MYVVALTASIAACNINLVDELSAIGMNVTLIGQLSRGTLCGEFVMQFLGLARAIKLVSLAHRVLA